MTTDQQTRKSLVIKGGVCCSVESTRSIFNSTWFIGLVLIGANPINLRDIRKNAKLPTVFGMNPHGSGTPFPGC